MRKLILTGLMIFLLPVHTWAHEPGGPDKGPAGGFEASFMLGPVLISGRPAQDEVGRDNDLITGYGRKADRETMVWPILMADICYTFASTGTMIFLKNPPGEKTFISALTGVKQPLGRAGALTLSLGYARKDVWEDPYLLGVKRDETFENDVVLNLSGEGILGTGALVEYSGRAVRVDDDRAGDRDSALRRDGATHALGLGYVLMPLEGHALTSRVKFLRGDFDGKSNSYDGYELKISHAFMRYPFAGETSLGFERKRYDRIHPVFDRTRDQDTFSGVLRFTVLEPLGFRKTSFTVLASYGRSDSNIDFFDSLVTVAGMSMGYRL